MIPGFSADDLQALKIFFPYAFERTMDAIQKQIRFVHYSSAESAMKMLSNGEVWMRKASAMNDFREIDYGKECLVKAYKSDAGERLKATLNGMFHGITETLEERFNGWFPYFETNTYLSCISEHDPSEDLIGRLSMWRAYGGTTGVAVVVRGSPFLVPSDALRAYTSPVAYLSVDAFQVEFECLGAGIVKNADFIKNLGKDVVLGHVFNAFRSAVMCTKHPGFREEREWRVVYNPKWEQSSRIVQSVETIRGVPQIIQKIPLQDVPEEGLEGISVPDLVERVIIGPTDFPWEIREAVIEMLTASGVADAAKKVIVSDIPLRH